jgi:sn-glycerol 3-phosphate transport system ATP-binding protein
MSAIVLEGVSKHYGTARAVDDVSFEAAAGSFLVLLGPSGCGKSTTLRLIAGLEEPTAGRVLIGGRDVTREPPSRRHVSMVFQSYALFPHLDVAENIVFGLKVRGVAADERARRLDRVGELVGLSGLMERRPAQLSGGQRQRVALARAIIAENPVCLMDEPLSNLDAQLRHEMRVEIRALQQRLGMTVVYVTHDQIEAMSMADRIILMREGRVEQAGAPELLYAVPASAFAARFIGTPPMNILRLAAVDGGAGIRGAAQARLVDGPGDALLLGIRPEAIRIVERGGLPAEVVSVDYHGADTVVTTRVGEEPLMLRVSGRFPAGQRGTIRVGWDASAAHVFDSKTGTRRAEFRALAPPA